MIDIDSNQLIGYKQNDQKMYFFNSKDHPITEHMYLGKCFIPAVSIVIESNILHKIGGFKYVENLPLIDFPTVLELSLYGEFYF